MNNEKSEMTVRIGNTVRYYRKQAKMSQEELALKLGYRSKASIAKIESGESRMPASIFVKVSKVLGVPLSELVDDIDGFQEAEQMSFEETVPTKVIESNDKFKDTVALLLTLDQEELERAYNVLNAMFGGGTHGKRNLER